MYEFLSRFISLGGDVTCIKYTFPKERDREIRSVLSYEKGDRVIYVLSDKGHDFKTKPAFISQEFDVTLSRGPWTGTRGLLRGKGTILLTQIGRAHV